MAPCDDFKIKITLLAEHTLPETERTAVEKHLVECVDCRTALAETRRLLDILSDAVLPEPRQEFLDHLSEKVRAEIILKRKSTPIQIIRFKRLSYLATTAAAAFLIAITGVFIHYRSGTRPDFINVKGNIAIEDVVISTFTDTPLLSANVSSPVADSSNERVLFDSHELEIARKQLNGVLPATNDDLLNTLNSLSEEEVREMLKSIDSEES